MSIFDDLLKESGNKFASKVSEGIDSDVDSYVDTGSYALNALLSGSIYGGLPSNKITALAGETSTGKCASGREKITIYADQSTIDSILMKLKAHQ